MQPRETSPYTCWLVGKTVNGVQGVGKYKKKDSSVNQQQLTYPTEKKKAAEQTTMDDVPLFREGRHPSGHISSFDQGGGDDDGDGDGSSIECWPFSVLNTF